MVYVRTLRGQILAFSFADFFRLEFVGFLEGAPIIGARGEVQKVGFWGVAPRFPGDVEVCPRYK